MQRSQALRRCGGIYICAQLHQPHGCVLPPEIAGHHERRGMKPSLSCIHIYTGTHEACDFAHVSAEDRLEQ